MFEFFRLWILVVAAGMAVAGGVAVLIVGTPVFAVAARLLDRPFWPARPDARTLSFQSWAYSVTFAVLAGWGLGMAIVVANAFSARESWVWWSIAAPLAVWFSSGYRPLGLPPRMGQRRAQHDDIGVAGDPSHRDVRRVPLSPAAAQAAQAAQAAEAAQAARSKPSDGSGARP